MKKRAAIIFFGTVFAILALTIAALQSGPVENWAKGQVQQQARNELHSDVRIGSLSIQILSFQPHVDLYDVEITPLLPAGETPFSEPTPK